MSNLRAPTCMLDQAMPDYMLDHLQRLVEKYTAQDADPKLWRRCPASAHFDDDLYKDELLYLASAKSAASQGLIWQTMVLKEEMGEPWPSRPSWPRPQESERLACYLHLLGEGFAHERHLFPGAFAVAQKGLTRILLKHPVLMHPRMIVEVKGSFGVGKVSVAHAVGLSFQAAFPSAAHGASEEQLRAFANHPCTLLGLRTRMLNFRNKPKYMTYSAPVLATALAHYQFRGQLMGTLAELERHVTPDNYVEKYGNAGFIDTSFAHSLEASPVAHWHTLALSFIGASGAWISANPGRPVWRHIESESYLSMLKERGISRNNSFLEHFGISLHSGLIPGSLKANSDVGMQGEGPSHEQVVDNTERLLRAMVASGVSAELSVAAANMHTLLARYIPPHCHVEHALAVIQTLDAHGARMTPDDFTSARTRDVWAKALAVHTTQTSMARVIDVVTQAAEPCSAAPRRRLRSL